MFVKKNKKKYREWLWLNDLNFEERKRRIRVCYGGCVYCGLYVRIELFDYLFLIWNCYFLCLSDLDGCFELCCGVLVWEWGYIEKYFYVVGEEVGDVIIWGIELGWVWDVEMLVMNIKIN